MRLRVSIAGEKAILAKLKQLGDTATKRAKAAIAEAAINVQRDAKRACPVDTGRLRSSIFIDSEDDGLTRLVGTNVDYFPHVEFGTVKAPAQPFLRPAWEAERPKLQKRIRDLLKG